MYVPIINVKVPFLAPATPPLTGESIKCKFFLFNKKFNFFEIIGSIVEQSMKVMPVHIYVYTCVYIYICMYKNMSYIYTMYIHICMYKNMYFIYIYMYIHTKIRIYGYSYIHNICVWAIHICVWAIDEGCTCIHICICYLHISIRLHLYIIHKYIAIHILCTYAYKCMYTCITYMNVLHKYI
jgi:hypothetical protein